MDTGGAGLCPLAVILQRGLEGVSLTMAEQPIPVSDAARPIQLEQGRTRKIDFLLYRGDGVTTEPVQDTDVGRVKVGDAFDGSPPILDLDTVAPTAAGSGCAWLTLDPPVLRVTFAQNDIALLEPGEYVYELGVVDDSESQPANAFRPVDRGRLRVVESLGGDVGLT